MQINQYFSLQIVLALHNYCVMAMPILIVQLHYSKLLLWEFHLQAFKYVHIMIEKCVITEHLQYCKGLKANSAVFYVLR